MTSYQSMDTAVELHQKVLGYNPHAPLVEKKFDKMKSLFWNEECQKAVQLEKEKGQKKVQEVS